MEKFVINLSLIALAIAAVAKVFPLLAVFILPMLGLFMIIALIAVLMMAHGFLSAIVRPRR